eukprot:s94_g62.t1
MDPGPLPRKSIQPPAERLEPGVGTTVRIEGSWASVQAAMLRRRLERLALLRPRLAIDLRTGPREVEILKLKQEDSTSRVQHVLGLGCARALCRVKCYSRHFACGLEGVISKLKDGHASDRFMFLYINGRFVEGTPIHRQIANFYATSSLSNASQGRGPMSIANAAAGNLRPLFVLNLVCPTDWYDLSFLPDRSVAQFRNWKQPIGFILDCLRSVWLEHRSSMGLDFEPSSNELNETNRRGCRFATKQALASAAETGAASVKDRYADAMSFAPSKRVRTN